MYKKYFKRLIDLYICYIIFPPFLIISIVISILIKLEDGGDIFYKSNRLGINKNQFKIYKFRSMKENAPDYRNTDGSTFNSDDDPRITNIGRLLRKSSLDELPQIFNVIKGDMSFIGPRPDTVEALDIYSKEEERKLTVKPGITGYNQAFYRNSISQQEKFKNDVYYVENQSVFLDIKIIIRTLYSVLFSKNINNK
ncbi:sugar transferase [Macrococcus psychrotolerans]|uniref:Sugar transferase n=1 Tax=Macrococcus psychrotolerans TaxID=3039389 RepID=A0AAT9P7V5_9STAP|nr:MULTISPECIES: sugar transferase [Macrococcus]QYA33534.1 sugar transferase [Macrococcus sp. 19Msa1099]QYA38354.1 sugar transferase [Macrococcus caseolyticus]QYA77061.1 sugar transferase [Macrococcus caseolyticus]